MVGIRNRDSCREYFKRLKILPLQSQYLLSFLLFVAENIDYFRLNSEIYGFNTKTKSNLHLPLNLLTPTHAQLNFIKNHLKNSYMFRSTTIFRELNILAKVTII